MNCESENGGDLVRKNNISVVRRAADDFDHTEIEKMLPTEFDDLYRTLPLTEETTCGIWFIRGSLWQK